MSDIMENNLFYSRKNNNNYNNKINNKVTFKKRKENALASLGEVENFLSNYKHFMRYIKLYKFFR